MYQESPPIPHSMAQLLWLLLASSLGWIGAELRSWLARRKRDPAEIRRIDAEAHNLKVTAEIAPMDISLELLREVREVTAKAEDRREQWLLREEQMRGQIIHWRNKAEELDGELIDSRQASRLMDSRLKLNEIQIKKLKSLLDYHNISYSELDQSRK
jgi:hypothetical protein